MNRIFHKRPESKLKQLLTIPPILIILFNSCTSDNYNGIHIGNSLLENRSISEQFELSQLIKGSLAGNSANFQSLLQFPCGGASGCYDLGSIITQITYKLGEKKMISIITSLPESSKSAFLQFLEVGLEYGYKLHDNQPNKPIQQEFPLLYARLRPS